MAQMSFEKHCDLTVSGPMARSVIDAIRTRFDVIDATRTAECTVLTIDAVDQAAVRALMIMLWDSGHEVLALSVTPVNRPTMQTREQESDQTQVTCGSDRILPGRHPELAVEALVVGLDGVDRQEHGLSDLPLAGRTRQHPQDG
jgi:hypothetical protein